MSLSYMVDLQLSCRNNTIVIYAEEVPLLSNVPGQGGSILLGFMKVQLTTKDVVGKTCISDCI